jgi:4-hydroxy-tetrahydrodipicolinate synthase
MFSGSIPALVTPFRGGSFDEAAFRRLVDWQIDNGSAALVPCGTTGEASTLSNAEHHRVIEVCIEQAAGRVPVIAGCGSNDTRNALLHMNVSRKAGASIKARGWRAGGGGPQAGRITAQGRRIRALPLPPRL